MTQLMNYIVVVVVGAMFVGAMASVLCAIYYAVFMYACIKPERKALARFMGPLIFVAPGILTEDGEKARIKFLIATVLYILLFGALMIITHQ